MCSSVHEVMQYSDEMRRVKDMRWRNGVWDSVSLAFEIGYSKKGTSVKKTPTRTR